MSFFYVSIYIWNKEKKNEVKNSDTAINKT